MNGYGKSAVYAVNLIKSEKVTPRAAWEMATKKFFTPGSSSQIKGCPRCAFLGICGEGFVKGVPSGKYTTSTKNKRYALDIFKELINNPNLKNDRTALWKAVVGGKKTRHNDQMDVVIALLEKDLIYMNNDE